VFDGDREVAHYGPNVSAQHLERDGPSGVVFNDDHFHFGVTWPFQELRRRRILPYWIACQ
jgi:hypothetical protein